MYLRTHRKRNQSIASAISSGSKTNQNRHQISSIFITQFTIFLFRFSSKLMEIFYGDEGNIRDKWSDQYPVESVNVPNIEVGVPCGFFALLAGSSIHLPKSQSKSPRLRRNCRTWSDRKNPCAWDSCATSWKLLISASPNKVINVIYRGGLGSSSRTKSIPNGSKWPSIYLLHVYFPHRPPGPTRKVRRRSHIVSNCEIWMRNKTRSNWALEQMESINWN